MNERRFLVAGAALAAVGLSSLALTTVLADDTPAATEVVAASTTEAPAVTPAPAPPPETAPPPTEPPVTEPPVTEPPPTLSPPTVPPVTVPPLTVPPSSSTTTLAPAQQGQPVPQPCTATYAVTANQTGPEVGGALWTGDCVSPQAPFASALEDPVIFLTNVDTSIGLCLLFDKLDRFLVWDVRDPNKPERICE